MNSSSKLTLGVIGAVVIVFALVYWGCGVSYRNKEAALRAQFDNTLSSNKVDYDSMWKIIAQTAQVPKQYSQDFKDAYSSIISSGAGTDQNAVKNLFAVATGMKVPQLDSSLYRKLQDVIESQRTKFSNAQKDALAIKNEHDTLRTTWPGSVFVGDVAPLKMTLVTSNRTDKAFEDGKDDNVDVFGNGK